MKVEKTSATAKNLKYLFANIAKSITGSLNVQNIIDEVMKQIDLFYKPDNWSLFQVDPVAQELYFSIAKGIENQFIKKIRIPIGEGIVGHVAKTGKILYVENVAEDKRFSMKMDKLTGFKTESVIAVPIIYRNEVLGVLELINLIYNKHLTKNEIEILKIIADFTAIALANARAYEHVCYLSISDPLTGLYNRKQLDKLIDTYSKLPIKSKNSHSIVGWIDIDYFKQINDQYGHEKGDEVLVTIAGLLRSCCRDKDYVFRIGGDEFLIIVADVEMNKVSKIKSRLHAKLINHCQQLAPHTGFSFGLASGENINLRQIIIEADNTMYENKNKHHSANNKTRSGGFGL